MSKIEFRKNDGSSSFDFLLTFKKFPELQKFKLAVQYLKMPVRVPGATIQQPSAPTAPYPIIFRSNWVQLSSYTSNRRILEAKDLESDSQHERLLAQPNPFLDNEPQYLDV